MSTNNKAYQSIAAEIIAMSEADQVDARRALIGLDTLADYAASLQAYKQRTK